MTDCRFKSFSNLQFGFLLISNDQESISKSFTIQNSTEFVETIQDQKLKPSHIKVSYDVKSLFTNIPIQDGLSFIKQYLENGGNSVVHAQVLHMLIKLIISWTVQQWDHSSLQYSLNLFHSIWKSSYLKTFHSLAFTFFTLMKSAPILSQENIKLF